MTICAIDLETHRIQPGLLAPPLVVGSYTSAEGAILLTKSQVLEFFPEVIRDSDLIITANGAYDFGVLASEGLSLKDIFKAYNEDRIYDVLIGQSLDAIAGGHLGRRPDGGMLTRPDGTYAKYYSLEIVVDLVLGRKDAKARDYWRERYALLENIPLSEWPDEAKAYPIDDTNNTFDVGLQQLGVIEGKAAMRNLHNMPDQVRAAWALHLASMWGLRTDGGAVHALEKRLADSHEEAVKKFMGVFLKPSGKRDMRAIKRAVAKAFGAGGDCLICGGSGKIESPKSGNPINCKSTLRPEDGEIIGCDGTGLNLSLAPTLPRSEGGGVKTDRDTLEESGDDLLESYASASEFDKIRESYVPWLLSGIDKPINPSVNVLLETGRTSYRGLEQTFPRRGGVRECIVPSFGNWFCSTDYQGIELCTLAQTCLDLLGKSRMAELINAGGGAGALHVALGAALAGMSEADFIVAYNDKSHPLHQFAEDMRQVAKKINFGLGGGMGAPKFVLTIRKRSEGTTTGPDGTVYAGIRPCLMLKRATRCGETKVTEWGRQTIPPTCRECILVATDLKKQWLIIYPEMVEYFKIITWQSNNTGSITQLRSDRVRGGIEFSSAANGYFQGLAADGAKRGLWLVSEACYTDEQSPLFGTRPVLFAHDEIISEMPSHTAHIAGPEQARIMVKGMKEYAPDVLVVAEPALMRRLSKKAEPVYDLNKKLIPWEPKEIAA